MKAAKWMVVAALAAPAAFAQSYYSGDPSLTRDELRECMARDSSQTLRQADLSREQAMAEQEARDLERNGQQLAQQLRRLDNSNLDAVATYNSHSAGQNYAVEAHNHRVAELNARAAQMNEDLRQFNAACVHPYRPRDRDAILYEQGYSRR